MPTTPRCLFEVATVCGVSAVGPFRAPIALPVSPFTTSQAIDAGISRWGLRQLVMDGLLRRPLREVYVDAALADTIDLRARSAALVVSKAAVLTDGSAAWLWGVDVMSPADLDVLPR